MKGIKIVHIILVVASGLFISCTSDNTDPGQLDDLYLDIPDAQFEAKLISLAIDSDNEINQRILKADAEEVLSLNLYSQNANDKISDLTGIEGFVNLKNLYAGRNNLVSIDLSANTLLDSLSLEANIISSIDVSNNTNLLWLDLKVNDIMAITGLSELAKLKWLSLSFNLLEEFSIHNESLVNLLISDNLLASFDVSGAVNLESILIKTNQLPTMDLSSNTKLEVLISSNNKLQALDLSNNLNLKYLWSSTNLYSNLDISHLQNLIDLRVDRNPNLYCIKILNGQDIPTIQISDYTELSTVCN
jgi:protein phosphatase 1 regulatory subunit 7